MILYVLYICLIIGFYAIRRAIFINGHEFEQTPGDLHDPGIKPGSPALQVDSLPAELPGKLLNHIRSHQKCGHITCVTKVITLADTLTKTLSW